MKAARRLVENRRNEQQEHELNKIFAAGSAASAGQKSVRKDAGKDTYAAAGGVLSQQFPANLQNLYERA